MRAATGFDEGEAQAALDACGMSSKTAIVKLLLGLDSAEAAAELLRQADGRVADALAQAHK